MSVCHLLLFLSILCHQFWQPSHQECTTNCTMQSGSKFHGVMVIYCSVLNGKPSDPLVCSASSWFSGSHVLYKTTISVLLGSFILSAGLSELRHFHFKVNHLVRLYLEVFTWFLIIKSFGSNIYLIRWPPAAISPHCLLTHWIVPFLSVFLCACVLLFFPFS